MDYTPQIRQALKEGFYEDWMPPDAYEKELFQQFEALVIQCKSYEQMNNQIITKLKSGIPLQKQLDELKSQCKSTSWINYFESWST